MSKSKWIDDGMPWIISVPLLMLACLYLVQEWREIQGFSLHESSNPIEQFPVIERVKPAWPIEEVEEGPSAVPEPPMVIVEPIPDSIPDSPPAPKYTKATIVFHCSDGCGPCIDWWRNDSELWRQAGWEVREDKYSGPRATPWFTVWDTVREFEVDGKLTYAAYKKAGGK